MLSSDKYTNTEAYKTNKVCLSEKEQLRISFYHVNSRNSAGRKKTNKEITNGALKPSNIAAGLLTTRCCAPFKA